jgi:aminoglycoside phosphotransferase
MSRQLDSALEWTARIIGGRVSASRAHHRWRPQYFVDVETADGKKVVVLRGYRDFGQLDRDEAGARARNRREAAVLEALQDTGVPVPKFYGFHEPGGWILMEFLTGTDQLTKLADRELQAKLFRDYLRTIAGLHALDPDTLNLPADLDRPDDAEDCIRRAYRHRLKAYAELEGDPDPLWSFALGWLERNRPKYADRFSLCTGDMGVDQFFFEDNRFKAIIDLENAYVSDPLRDIGMMRYRDMLYPIPRMGEHIRYFGELCGRPVTDHSLHFWTILGMLGSSPAQRTLLRRPNPMIPAEMSLLLAMTPTRRRGCAEAFHQLHRWPLPDRPTRPPEVENRHTRFARFVRDQLDTYYLPKASEGDRYTLSLTRAHADMTVLANTIGPQITRANCDDLAELLGRRPDSELEGLARLEQQMAVDPERNLQNFMTAMYRIECRNEYLAEPLMRETGLAFASPLQPIPC